jgi:hypothetical protein
MLDYTMPCGTTGPRIAAFASGGPWDKHILDAERGKLTTYADKPDGFSLVPAVVGMYGEVGCQLTAYLAGLATSAAEREQLGDPKLTRLFRQRFLLKYETRLELSIALARGKAGADDRRSTGQVGRHHSTTRARESSVGEGWPARALTVSANL